MLAKYCASLGLLGRYLKTHLIFLFLPLSRWSRMQLNFLLFALSSLRYSKGLKVPLVSFSVSTSFSVEQSATQPQPTFLSQSLASVLLGGYDARIIFWEGIQRFFSPQRQSCKTNKGIEGLGWKFNEEAKLIFEITSSRTC